jgi:hypothetical protein
MLWMLREHEPKSHRNSCSQRTRSKATGSLFILPILLSFRPHEFGISKNQSLREVIFEAIPLL